MLGSNSMRRGDTSGPVYRFGAFELDQRTGELRKRGVRVRLQEQPLQILVLLLEHGGEVVTREQIQEKLWDCGTHVDYDNAINSAVRKLREALGDTAENPRFIETFARRGYRFVCSLDALHETRALAPVLKVQNRRSHASAISATAFLLIATVGSWALFKLRTTSNPV